MVQLFLADKPEFQSTLPARGATRTIKKSCKNIWISIHAPRTGSDAVKVRKSLQFFYFNPRSPHGERLAARPLLVPTMPISIHAPRTGSDYPN